MSKLIGGLSRERRALWVAWFKGLSVGLVLGSIIGALVVLQYIADKLTF